MRRTNSISFRGPRGVRPCQSIPSTPSLHKQSVFIRLPRRSLAKMGACRTEAWRRRVHPRLNPLFYIPTPAISNPKSTPTYRKSTGDLRLEPLIWGENGLPTSFLPACRRSFCPITTRERNRAGQKPTEIGQKRISSYS